MTDMTHTPVDDLPSTPRKHLSMESIVVGLALGGALIWWSGGAWLNGDHVLHTAVVETFWVAVYLTMVVAFCGFKMPVFFAQSAYWSTWSLIMFSGHISLLFDSFAVVLLLATGITFLELPNTNGRFNRFAVKVAAAFAALTVGGGFYLGELWGLPYYITNGLDNPIAGFPLLLVLTPYCAFIAHVFAKKFPVKMEGVAIDGQQKLAAFEFTVALLLIIVTHHPLLCIGVLLVYSTLQGKTGHLVEKVTHEVKEGAQNALGLIAVAVVITLAGKTALIQPYLEGVGLFLGAAISSPFAGAMAPQVTDLQSFYEGLSLIMLGAPLFVWSSLVAIVVFNETIDYDDLPKALQPFASKRKGLMHEAVGYTFLVIPMLIGLAVLLWLANSVGLFAAAAEVIGVTMEHSSSAGTASH